LWWNIILIVVIPPLYWISANSWGLSGLSAMMIATQLLLFPLIWRFLVFPLCDARFSEYLAQSLTPMALSLATGATAYLATRHIPHGTVRLLAGCVLGAAVYLALSRTFNRRWLDAISMVIKFSR